MSDLTFRTLNETDFSQMYRSFIEAFSQYAVNMEMSKDTFHNRMIGKLNLDYDLSPAAFDGDKLVGFIFHAVNMYEGKKTAYNGGTGVIPGYWGRKITKRLHEFIIPKLKKEKVQRCLLEVITSNQQGINAYTKTGFSKTKRFKCFKLTGKMTSVDKSDKSKVIIQNEPNFRKYASITNGKASMLDSFEQLQFNMKNEMVLEAYREKELAGYLVFQPKLGRISQFGVNQKHRRLGVGTDLLKKSIELSSMKTLTVINVEESELEIVSFLKSNGFENQLDQWEMELVL